MSSLPLGSMLRDTRSGLGLSLHDVAERAGCSSGYVHKLEMDRVRTPSPRVLSGLAEALGLAYSDVMIAAGYGPQESGPVPRPLGPPGAVKRFSNAHIVELLETLQRDVGDIKSLLSSRS